MMTSTVENSLANDIRTAMFQGARLGDESGLPVALRLIGEHLYNRGYRFPISAQKLIELMDEIESIGFHRVIAVGYVLMLLAKKVDELLPEKVNACESFTELCELICDTATCLLFEFNDQDEKSALVLIDHWLSLMSEPSEASLLMFRKVKESFNDNELAKKYLIERAHHFFEDLYDKGFLNSLSELDDDSLSVDGKNFIFSDMLASNSDKLILMAVELIFNFGHDGDDDYVLTKLTDLAVKGNHHAWQVIQEIWQQDFDADKLIGQLITSGLNQSLSGIN
ncbi:MAG: hypothetical protein IE928_02490 [Gammaproteobacteria bacterium]|nr:hypothetical protein [Gammaproteobacteria bacterium]